LTLIKTKTNGRKYAFSPAQKKNSPLDRSLDVVAVGDGGDFGSIDALVGLRLPLYKRLVPEKAVAERINR